MPHPKSLPTPTNPSGTGITYHGAATISAPAPKVWQVLLDFPSYSSWNTFTPRCAFSGASSRPLQVGDKGDLDACVASAAAAPRLTRVQVTHIEIPTDDQEGREPGVGAKYRLSWKGVEFPSWTLRAERVMEVEVLERGEDGRERCEVRTWETMAGPLAGVVKMAVGAGLDGAFARFAADMKAWVEGGMGEGKDGADGEAED